MEEAAESGKAEMDARAEDIRVELLELEETLRARQAEKRDLEINQEKEEKVIKAQMSKIQGAVRMAKFDPEGRWKPAQAGMPNFRGLVLGCIDAEFSN